MTRVSELAFRSPSPRSYLLGVEYVFGAMPVTSPMEEHRKVQEVPSESIEFLSSEAVRQLDQLFEAKESVSNRTAILIGLAGVMLTIFVETFTAFWSSIAREASPPDRMVLWSLVALTLLILSSLLVSVLICLLVLVPKRYNVGAELRGVYRAAHDVDVTHDGLREGVLRGMLRDFTSNYLTFRRNVYRYDVASLLLAGSLVPAVLFVILVLFAEGSWADMNPGQTASIVGGVVLTVVLLIMIRVGLWRRNWRADALREERRADEFAAFIRSVDRVLHRTQ